jgi:hypothetical protein
LLGSLDRIRQVQSRISQHVRAMRPAAIRDGAQLRRLEFRHVRTADDVKGARLADC